ncbi:MAG TPA: hypothetical protein VMB21_03035 [Candidatus Limnocylindria bacterium]|nr:hypothetical protein [Candidatus Limnocylindria bacterium]
MKCFYHQTVDAVALCKSCNRALCPGCIAEVGLSCSCRNRCEADVATHNDLLERGRTAYQKTSATYLRSGVFMMVIGNAFVIVGIHLLVRGVDVVLGLLPCIMGLLFVGWGISYLVSAKRMKQK